VILSRLVRQYGLSYFWFRSAPTLLLEKFKGIYGLQSRGQGFKTPIELLRQVGLFNWTQQDMRSAVEVVIPSALNLKRLKRTTLPYGQILRFSQGSWTCSLHRLKINIIG